jgi:hypothetical protein
VRQNAPHDKAAARPDKAAVNPEKIGVAKAASGLPMQ